MENINFGIESIKIGLGAFVAMLMNYLGVDFRFVIVLLCSMAVDTVLGWLIALHNKEYKSSKARWGFVGKIVELMFVAMLYLLDWCFDINVLAHTGITYFILCECASVVENVAKINHNVPQGLVEVLTSFKAGIGGGIVKRAKEILDNLSGGKEDNNDD